MADPSDNPTLRSTPRSGSALPTPEHLSELLPQLEVQGLLGQGGMGAVYRARQKSLDRDVALKIIHGGSMDDPSFVERFEREARALARLHHPGIVMIHDSGQVEGLVYLIMEFVDGTTLRHLMSNGRVESSQTLAITRQVCEALSYAHGEGIIHRDIKPENILLNKRGKVKIADFGLAKLLEHRGLDRTLTTAGQIMGTMHYMAPEQIERPTEVDRRSDVYAMGVVLYEMLTGELPMGRFPLPSERGVSDARLDDIVLKALEKDTDRRYQQASELSTDLDRVSGITHVGAVHVPSSLNATPPTLPHASRSPAVAVTTPFRVRTSGNAYLCWFLMFVGVCGGQRFYAGKYITGTLWLLTGGIFLIGQFIDLALIPNMIEGANMKEELKYRRASDPGMSASSVQRGSASSWSSRSS